jgi:hypothetical protein
MRRFQIDDRSARFRLAVVENPGRAIEKLASPLRDLIDVDVELLSQIGQRLLPLQHGRRRFRLEGRVVVSAGPFVICAPDTRRHSPLSGRKSTYRLVQIS